MRLIGLAVVLALSLVLAPLAAQTQQAGKIPRIAGTLPLQSLKRETSTIPIVAAAIGDAVASGLVASLARPGGNLTGLSRHHDPAVTPTTGG